MNSNSSIPSAKSSCSKRAQYCLELNGGLQLELQIIRNRPKTKSSLAAFEFMLTKHSYFQGYAVS